MCKAAHCIPLTGDGNSQSTNITVISSRFLPEHFIFSDNLFSFIVNTFLMHHSAVIQRPRQQWEKPYLGNVYPTYLVWWRCMLPFWKIDDLIYWFSQVTSLSFGSFFFVTHFFGEGIWSPSVFSRFVARFRSTWSKKCYSTLFIEKPYQISSWLRRSLYSRNSGRVRIHPDRPVMFGKRGAISSFLLSCLIDKMMEHLLDMSFCLISSEELCHLDYADDFVCVLEYMKYA